MAGGEAQAGRKVRGEGTVEGSERDMLNMVPLDEGQHTGSLFLADSTAPMGEM